MWLNIKWWQVDLHSEILDFPGRAHADAGACGFGPQSRDVAGFVQSVLTNMSHNSTATAGLGRFPSPQLPRWYFHHYVVSLSVKYHTHQTSKEKQQITMAGGGVETIEIYQQCSSENTGSIPSSQRFSSGIIAFSQTLNSSDIKTSFSGCALINTYHDLSGRAKRPSHADDENIHLGPLHWGLFGNEKTSEGKRLFDGGLGRDKTIPGVTFKGCLLEVLSTWGFSKNIPL